VDAARDLERTVGNAVPEISFWDRRSRGCQFELEQLMPSPRSRAPARTKLRTPEARLRRKAQALSGLAMETLAAIMRSEGQDSIRLAAAREVLDRAHGRPKLGEPEGASDGMTVIVKRFSDVTEAEVAEAELYA
jgi:hypothetical protein